LILPPLLLAVNTMGFTTYLQPRYRWWAIVLGCVALLTTLAAWRLGIFPGDYLFENGRMVIVAGALELPPFRSVLFLTTTALLTILTGGLALTRVRDALARTEHQLFLYAWHLREVVPEAIRGPTDPTGARRASPADAR
jgi:hypothetical protein